MIPTMLFLVTGSQPDGIKSLQVQDYYRAPTAKQAAMLARNYWQLNHVMATRFQVQHFHEPIGGVGRVWLDPKTLIYDTDDLFTNVIPTQPPESESA